MNGMPVIRLETSFYLTRIKKTCTYHIIALKRYYVI